MASNAATLRNRCEQIDFSQRRMIEGSAGWNTFVIDEMDEPGYFWVDREARRIVFGPETWRILGMDMKIRYGLIAQVREGGASGIRELPLHASPYMELVLADAAANGTDVVRIQDRIEALRAKCSRLMAEAESCRTNGVSPRGAQVLALRFGQAQQEFETLASEMVKLDSMLRLVGVAVSSAVT